MADYAVGYDDIQRVTIRFHRPVDSDIVNDRFRDIRALGIYTGGRITTWAVGKATLSALVCEIRGQLAGDYHQVRVETTEEVTNIDLPDNEYLVLQWAYTGVEDTDFMVINHVADPGDDDIVVGQIVGGSVRYVGRTTPDTHHLFLRVEATEPASNNVRIRTGVGHGGSAHNSISDNLISLSGYVENDEVYIYVNDSGGVNHSKTASTYAGKALLVKITMPANGKPENNDIEDVRSFVTPPAIPDESSITRTSAGKLQVKNLGITNSKINSNVADGVTIEKDGDTGQLKIGSFPISGYGSSMNLSGSGTYTVLCWATYFTCTDSLTHLKLDGVTKESHTGFGGDSSGCDQNTIMTRVTGVSSGNHTWSIHRGIQHKFMWLAFLE